MRIFIGWDPREVAAYDVLVHSLKRHTSIPLEIEPLILSDLRAKGLFTRENQGTTEFSLTRFLVPYLSGYQGRSIFMDCDMLCLQDIGDIIMWLNDSAVQVCQHSYIPRTTTKATGIQTNYPKKNWSSLMVFNNEKCRALTPDYVNAATPSDLHQFRWTEDVGTIPLTFNWLVGEYPLIPNPRIVHYTLGTPCFEEYKDCDYSKEWHLEYELMNRK